MKIVEYKRHLLNGNDVDPEWIIHGGFMRNHIDNTYIGLVLDEADRTYYIPDTVTYLTEEDVVQRMLDIHEISPFLKMRYIQNSDGGWIEDSNVPMSVEEVTSVAQSELSNLPL